jgi:hypothetical protein
MFVSAPMLRAQETNDAAPADASDKGLAAASPSPSEIALPPDNSAPPDEATPSETPAPPETNAPPEPEPSSEDEPNTNGMQGLTGRQGLVPNAFGENGQGIPYASVINTTGADVNSVNLINGHPVNTDFLNSPKVGNVEGTMLIQPTSGNYVIPFLRGGSEPDYATLKAGPFYIKFHSLDGLVLYDDNYNQSHSNRLAETLILLRLNMTVIAQLTDNLQFALSGSIGYLPLQNQFGVQSNVYSSLGLLLFGPLLTTQFVYDTVVAGWPVRFADDFRVGSAVYSDSLLDNFDLFTGDYLSREQNGEYVFAAGRTPAQQANYTGVNSDQLGLITYANTVSALTDHLLPGDTRLTLRIEHTDLWYNQDNRGLPASRDDLYASLVSERENMRFKPYITYEATYVDQQDGITQQANAGIFGPIDDQLFLQAQAGIYVDGMGHQGLLYNFQLNHDAGPYTTEHLTLARSLDYFDQEQQTSEYYRLNQVIGPTIDATLFAAHSSFQELINNGVSSRDEELAGAQMVWYMGPKTSLQLAGIVERQQYHDDLRVDSVTGRAILNRILTDTLTMQLLYEYQRVSSNHAADSYYENLVYFRIIKLLN